MMEKSAVYIHIPFCRKICPYCDFCKVYYNENLVSQYLEALAKEIEEASIQAPCQSVYIGGGTPSCLSLSLLEKLLLLVKKLPICEATEFTVECNIEDIVPSKIALLKKYGVNRVSVGIETSLLKFQKKLNRVVSRRDIQTKMTLLKEAGFSNINVDLMYAFEGETLEDLEKDLAFFLKLQVPHLSTYSLQIEPHTEFYIHHFSSVDEELDALMYQKICKTLKEAGYEHYEISNFAKKGYSSRHNLTYWNNQEYYGFGTGAHFYRNGFRGHHSRNIYAYLHNDDKIYQEKVSLEEQMDEFVLLGLRKQSGLSLREFEKKYHHPLKEVYSFDSFLEKGILKEENGQIFLPESYFYVMNQVLVQILNTKKI